MEIQRHLFSRNDPVLECQARFLGSLLGELVEEYRLEAGMIQRDDLELEDVLTLPAYKRLLIAGEACGFVCRDLEPDAFDIQRPARDLEAIGLADLRAYIHVLMRAERWSDGYSSPIQSAIQSGALGVVARRLEGDDSLYEAFS